MDHTLRRMFTSPAALAAVPILLCVFATAPCMAQDAPPATPSTHGRRTLTAKRTDAPITVDGALEDPAWQQAALADGLLQKEPHEGDAATERTEFRVLYTATTLYIGVTCFDSDPAAVLSSERRRDSSMESDDTIALVLDTFHDHRNAFLFRTNPLGVQYDALITDEGKEVNANWDESWQVVAGRTPAGWTAEFAIPFKSLRVRGDDANGERPWGLELERVIRRKNEWTYWNAYRRGFRIENISQAGHLAGLREFDTGLRLRVKPFALAGVSQSVDGSERAWDNSSNAGLEVMKWRVTPSLTADATWRTDFAQSDVDDLQVNLERFPLFFPEKREFFQEGAGIFDIGTATSGLTNHIKLFHSRQIGLSPRRRPVPIVGGGRLTGRLQGMTLGLMDVQTDTFPGENIPASNHAVVRVKRDVFSRSTLGGFLLNVERSDSGDFNRLYGMDGRLALFQHFTADGFFARSHDGNVRTGWTSSGNAKWDSDFLLAGLQFLSVDPDFRDDLGYVRRTDIRRYFPSLSFRPRPNIPWVRQMEIGATWEYITNLRNEVVARTDKYIIQTYFNDGGVLRVIPFDYELDRVDGDFEISPGVTVPAGSYQWNVWVVRYSMSPKRRLAGSFDFSHRYGFYGGNMYKFQFTPVLHVSEGFSVEADYEIDIASLPDGDFTQHAANVRVNYSFTNQWLTSTTVQYDNIQSFLGFHFRLNYIYRPGDDFFLIYTEGRRVGGERFGEKDRSLQLKLTYSFDY